MAKFRETRIAKLLERSDKSGHFRLAFLEAGMSFNNRFYDPDTLRRDGPSVFEGVPIFWDHPTESEQRERPERSARDKAGILKNVHFDEQLQALVGDAVIVDPVLKELALEAEKAGVLEEFLKFSISADGELEDREVDGQTVQAVTRLHAGPFTSVDHVTVPAAGGRAISRLAASLCESVGGRPVKYADLPAPQKQALMRCETIEEARELLESFKLEGLDESFAAEFEAAWTKLHEVADEPEPEPEPVEEPKPEAKPDTAAQEALAEVRKLQEALKARERRESIKERLEGFDAEDVALLKPLLESAKDEKVMDTIVSAYKGRLAKLQESPAFPTAGRVEGGNDNWDYFIARLDSWIGGGRPIEMKDGKRAEGFAGLREAIQEFPPNRNRRIDLSPAAIPTHLTCDFRAYVPPGEYNSAYDSYVVREGRRVKLKEAITTSQFGEIFADRQHKAFMREYDAVSDWQSLIEMSSDITFVSDFKTHRFIQVGGYGDIPAVTEGATYQTATTPADVEETGGVDKYGHIESVTFEAMTDPDGQRMRMIPGKLGAAMGRTLREDLLDTITTDNPTMGQDSTTLYHANHNNTGTTALTVDAVYAVTEAMRVQTELTSSKVLGSINDPMFILHPPELTGETINIVEPEAGVAFTQVSADSGTAANSPLAFRGRLRRVELTHHTDANNWFAVANPSRMPTFAFLRLQGVPNPEFFQQFSPESDSMFDSDTGKWKVRFFWEMVVLDYRSFYRQVVA